MGASLFSLVTNDRTKDNSLKLHQGKFWVDIREKIVHRKCCETLEQATQASGGVSIPEDT